MWRKGHLTWALKDIRICYMEKGGKRERKAKVWGTVAFTDKPVPWLDWEAFEEHESHINATSWAELNHKGPKLGHKMVRSFPPPTPLLAFLCFWQNSFQKVAISNTPLNAMALFKSSLTPHTSLLSSPRHFPWSLDRMCGHSPAWAPSSHFFGSYRETCGVAACQALIA